MWTIDELVERVREALAAEYSGASDGRVRDLPDRRAIRWYTTIGLVDRPLGMRGRTALYGPRHLQQIVAIKRRQAAGRSLSQIQMELSWVSDVVLADVSRVPESLLEADGPDPDDPTAARRAHFWSHSPASPAPGVTALYPERYPFAHVPPADDLSETTNPGALSAEADVPASSRGSTTSAGAAHEASAPPASRARVASESGARSHRMKRSEPTTLVRPQSENSEASPGGSANSSATRGGPVKRSRTGTVGVAVPGSSIGGVALGGGAILLVPHSLSDRDRDDIVTAAAPLLDLLEARGLVEGRSA